MWNGNSGPNEARARTRKLALAALLAAATVLLLPLSIPLGPSRCFPFQHAINVIAGVTLGPYWAFGAAFVASFARNAMGTGTILAFPGSLFGALAVGFAARLLPRTKQYWATFAEPIATVTLGAWVASLIVSTGEARAVMFGTLAAAFFMSSAPGAVLGWFLLRGLDKALETKEV